MRDYFPAIMGFLGIVAFLSLVVASPTQNSRIHNWLFGLATICVIALCVLGFLAFGLWKGILFAVAVWIVGGMAAAMGNR